MPVQSHPKHTAVRVPCDSTKQVLLCGVLGHCVLPLTLCSFHWLSGIAFNSSLIQREKQDCRKGDLNPSSRADSTRTCNSLFNLSCELSLASAAATELINSKTCKNELITVCHVWMFAYLKTLS